MVIAFSHFDFTNGYGDAGNALWNIWSNPTMGVDFFFILSGFGMMLGSLRRDSQDENPIGGFRGCLRFGVRHVRKIYPVYILMLLLGIPYRIADGVMHGSPASVQGARCVLFLLIDVTLLQSLTGRVTFDHSLNGVSWFLSTLFCIYLVSPLLMRLVTRRLRTVRTALLGVLASMACAVALGFAFTCIDAATWFFDDLCYASPFRRVFYVTAGMCLARAYALRRQADGRAFPRFIESGASEYMAIAVSMAWFYLRAHVVAPLGCWVYLFDMLIVLCDVYALAVGRGKVSSFFATRPMVYLGEISMYIFIVHFQIREYVDLVVRVLGIGSLPVGIAEIAVILALTFAASAWLGSRNGVTAHSQRRVESAAAGETASVG